MLAESVTVRLSALSVEDGGLCYAHGVAVKTGLEVSDVGAFGNLPRAHGLHGAVEQLYSRLGGGTAKQRGARFAQVGSDEVAVSASNTDCVSGLMSAVSIHGLLAVLVRGRLSQQ